MSKEPLDKDALKKEEYFDRDNNFIDYFIEIGIKPDSMTRDYIFERDLDELNFKIQPEIITKFPEYNKKSISIDNSLISHIFPKKFEAIKTRSPPQPKMYNIILDNQFYSAVYTNKFISCLLFYESRIDYEILFYNYLLQKKDNLSDESQNTIKGKINKCLNEKMKGGPELFIPKCICLVSVHPFLDYFQTILKVIYTHFQKKTNILFDAVIEKLLIEIPYPPRGQVQYKLNLLGKPIALEQKKLNELPLINFDLLFIFQTFSADKLIEIYRYVFFEKKIVFFSEDIGKLSTAIMGFITLLSPFKYQFQISSVLPKEYYCFLDNVTPYIFGINEKYTETFLEDNNLDITETEILFVDIDRKDYSSYKNGKAEDPIPEMMKSFQKLLVEGIRNLNKKKDVNAYDYRELFFSSIVTLVQNIFSYINTDISLCRDSNDVASMLKKEEFLSSINNANEKDFYSHFFETQMFIEFMFKKLTPKNTMEKIEVAFLEEKIEEKKKKNIFQKSKKESSIFNVKVDFTKDRPIDLNEPKFFDLNKIFDLNIIENREFSVLRGIIPEKNKDGFSFSSPIFPSLLTDKIFEKSIGTFCQEPDYNSSLLEKISKDEKLNSNSIKKEEILEMENNIYLIWAILWSLTFWYTDKEEKEYRFKELLTVLGKAQKQEIEIFEIIFDSIFKFGTDEMALKLYNLLITLRLNPSWYIFNKITSVRNKSQKNYQAIQRANTKQNVEVQKKKMIGIRKRTLKDENDRKILGEDVVFSAFEKCIDCQEEVINLYEQSKDFKNMREEEMWIVCPKCKGNILLKLNFRFGVEVFNSDINKESSSRLDSVILYSTKTLKDKLMSVATSLKSNENFDVEKFKLKYKVLFWNSIWYFKIKALDISFMLPYCPKVFNYTNQLNDFISFYIGPLVESQLRSSVDVQPISSKEKAPFFPEKENLDITKIRRGRFDPNELVAQIVYQFELIPYVGVLIQKGNNQEISVNDFNPIRESKNTSSGALTQISSVYDESLTDINSTVAVSLSFHISGKKNKMKEKEDKSKYSSYNDSQMFGVLQENFVGMYDDTRYDYDLNSSGSEN